MKNLITILVFTIHLISCKDYYAENYPKSVSKTGTYEHIESCYFMQSGDISLYPKNVKDSIESYYEKRIGKEYSKRLKFNFGYIHSNKPIQDFRNKTLIDSIFDYEERLKICDTTYNYPVYTSAYSLVMEEIGIKELGLNLVIDSKGKIIKDFQFPHFKENINEIKIISIDSVISILIKRKISNENLYIDIEYDNETGNLFWKPKTDLYPNDQSCIITLKTHFSMDMFTGEIKEFNNE